VGKSELKSLSKNDLVRLNLELQERVERLERIIAHPQVMGAWGAVEKEFPESVSRSSVSSE